MNAGYKQMPFLERHDGSRSFKVHDFGETLLFLQGAEAILSRGGNRCLSSRPLPVHRRIHRGWGRSRGNLSSPWTETFAQSMGDCIIDAFFKANPGRVRAEVRSCSTVGYISSAAWLVYEGSRTCLEAAPVGS